MTAMEAELSITMRRAASVAHLIRLVNQPGLVGRSGWGSKEGAEGSAQAELAEEGLARDRRGRVAGF